MLNINISITIVVCFLTPLSLWFQIYQQQTHLLFVNQSSLRSDINSYVDEMISNQRAVHAFNQQKYQIIFLKLMIHINTAVKATSFSSLTNPATRVVNAIVYAFTATFGGLIVIKIPCLSVSYLHFYLMPQYTKPLMK